MDLSVEGKGEGGGLCTYLCGGELHGGYTEVSAPHLVQQRLDGWQRSCEAREQRQYDDVEELQRTGARRGGKAKGQIEMCCWRRQNLPMAVKRRPPILPPPLQWDRT